MSYSAPFNSATDSLAESSKLTKLLSLEEIDRDLYRTEHVGEDTYALYGGQVAAQALYAAGLTIDSARTPHSMHGYFLRRGDAHRPTMFRVHRDHDGRTYSARRVEARQDGKVIFSMSASFQVGGSEGLDIQCPQMPEVTPPAQSAPISLARLHSMEGRTAGEPYPDSAWPTCFWARATVEIGSDPLLNACVLMYLSDISSGLTALSDGNSRPGASLDHAVWFHRPALMDDWVLMDLHPQTVSSERGWYTGNIFNASGQLTATLAQECLFRPEAKA